MKILGLIPARAGSKGVKDKNIRRLNGKSLVERAFEAALASGVLDRIVLSTDSDAIAGLGRGVGIDVPFMRPSSLATDEAPMIRVVQHAITSLGQGGYVPDALLLLQPTAPLRTPQHIKNAASMLDGSDSVCSVVQLAPEVSPHFVMKIEDGLLRFFVEDGESFTRRQDVPPAYRRDGTVYLTRVPTLLNGSFYGERCVPMVLDTSESVTIDSPADWTDAESRLVQLEGVTSPSDGGGVRST